MKKPKREKRTKKSFDKQRSFVFLFKTLGFSLLFLFFAFSFSNGNATEQCSNGNKTRAKEASVHQSGATETRESGHTLIVKVLSSNVVLRKGRSVSQHFHHTRIAECLIGDGIGSILFTARNDQEHIRKTENRNYNFLLGGFFLVVDKKNKENCLSQISLTKSSKSDIGNLIHLRFLSLRDFTFLRSKLPSSLGNLRCLRTLDLRVESYFSSVHVPDVIWKMEQLRHLYLPEERNRKTQLKLGTLRNLLMLVNFNTKNCYLEDLLNKIKLRELRICGPFHIENFEEDLEQNQPIIASKCLHSLSIVSSNIDPRHLAHLLSCYVNICEFFGSIKGRMKLPEYHHFSSNIAYICLSNSEIEEDSMPTLEMLPNLRILELHYCKIMGGKMVCSAQRFLRLESLILSLLLYLEEWKVEEGAMPALRHLEIESCLELKMLPDGLKFITTLQELKIESMQKAFEDKVVEGGEDFYKVQHVPSIIFQNCDW